MSWASHHTREMATSPPGRHRRRRRPILPAVGGASLLVLLVVAVMFAPALIGSPAPDRLSGAAAPVTPPAGQPSPTSTAATPEATSTPTRTPAATTAPASTTPPSTARLGRPDEPGQDSELVALEQAVFELTNEERKRGKCSALRMDGRLREAARLHSADMIHSGYFDHTSPDGRGPGERLADAGYPTNVGWAENIARGYPSAEAVMEGWMGSPGHRANILNCEMKAVGVGVARTGSGRLYWTQNFGGR